MARLIKHTKTGPIEVKPSAESAWICMCGLSRNYPFCDGHHKLARQQEQPGKVYTYADDKAEEVSPPSTLREV